MGSLEKDEIYPFGQVGEIKLEFVVAKGGTVGVGEYCSACEVDEGDGITFFFGGGEFDGDMIVGRVWIG